MGKWANQTAVHTVPGDGDVLSSQKRLDLVPARSLD